MSTDTAASPSTAGRVPDGTWRVDPAASTLGFKAKGGFGLVPVKGTFKEFGGTLTSTPGNVRGELVAQAASLDTKLGPRDKHLRSADFFDVENHPTVTFVLTDLQTAPDGALHATGTLQLRATNLRLEVPVTASSSDDGRLHLSTKVSVDRTAAGIGWSKFGMVKGDAELTAKLVLDRAD
ncbi:Protein YceI [Paraconexibacter sp. AEG42_29]|uniref:Protein YceI n=1 Tax=Paraconexibacter sp. AEG42_29 TaxID=2997339 RepID=A0AAU7ARX4_9ACTN